MKFYQYTLINFLSCLVLLLISSCQDSQTPAGNVEVHIEIIPYTDIPTDWDSTFYQHDTNWSSFLDTTAADSLAEFLQETDLPITDMWYPQVESECGIPILAGSDIIVKLSVADTSIYQFGFKQHDGFPLACVAFWRHYKYIRD